MTKTEFQKTDYQLKVIGIIKQIREDNNLAQAGLASFLQISYGMVGNIESPKFPQKYSLSHIKTICDAFGINILEVFLNAEELSTDPKELPILLINKLIEYYGKD